MSWGIVVDLRAGIGANLALPCGLFPAVASESKSIYNQGLLLFQSEVCSGEEKLSERNSILV